MKKVLLLLVLLISFYQVYSQDYDLVVRTNGDSIACHIDSITDTKIYLEIKARGVWIHTFMDKAAVKEFKYSALYEKKIYFEPGTSLMHSKIQLTKNPHNNMYMFSPTSYSLSQGDFYYSTYYLLTHDIQYGITDRFTFRAGADIFFIPFYLLPSYTFPINDKSAFAVGDLLLITGDLFAGNLLYGMYTRGNYQNNFTIGAGFWTSNISRLGPTNASPAFNFSAQLKLSGNTYFLTENYGFNLYMDQWIYNELTDVEEEYARADKILFGLSGIRLISRKNIRRSWQFGLVYVFCFNGKAPDRYNNPGWRREGAGKIEIYPVPLIGYSVKFGKKY